MKDAVETNIFTLIILHSPAMSGTLTNFKPIATVTLASTNASGFYRVLMP